MTTTLLTLNKPNRNNHTYTTEVMQTAIDKFVASGKPLVLQRFPSHSHEVIFENVCGSVTDLKCEGDMLIGTLKVFPGDEAFLGLSVRPTMVGKVSDTGVISDVELISFTFTADPA